MAEFDRCPADLTAGNGRLSGETTFRTAIRLLVTRDGRAARVARPKARPSISTILGRDATVVAQQAAEPIDAHDLPAPHADLGSGFADLVADPLVVALAPVVELDIFAQSALEGPTPARISLRSYRTFPTHDCDSMGCDKVSESDPPPAPCVAIRALEDLFHDLLDDDATRAAHGRDNADRARIAVDHRWPTH